MTKLQMLADMLCSVANRIAEVDQQQADDDMQAGVIEGKLAAYKEFVRMLGKMILEEA